ncbi:PQQ-dependent sugar dehydrogenase [Saccharomonospora xinjiangensis]|uniref:PQQ-dependent sugar dehydrogenase n=1 Tax=Saccharomonospora xinjiangensis TaxID=75294 RepID=UPI0010C36DAA|nr:PQQ-dependent sugar dehydrogenase [Saccharomonospora xinjiangensis]QBQ61942.1 Soluble aldose sugar dehydrogenase YliI precursor [Saccharomonospora xinjiangensis]
MRVPALRLTCLVVLTVLAGALAACGVDPESGASGPHTTTRTAPDGMALRVERVADGLQHPWDLGFLPGGALLVTERRGEFVLVDGDGTHRVEADTSSVYAEGEGGLMGLVVHPDFGSSRLFTTCQTHQRGGKAVDVRLVTWRLSEDRRSAEHVRDLVTGLPINDSGRHSGCRPALAGDGSLLVGTGDTANNPTIPQDRTSLGGKVLRVDLRTGQGLPDNPFASSRNEAERRVYTYGHRNVQGVAVRPGTGQVYTAEHGPTGFDEVNRIRAGRNYGWDPSKGGSNTDVYDEDVPMTDLQRFPDAVPPLWTSGESATEAPSGAAFVSGSRWGPLNGTLAVVALRGQKLLLFKLDDAGEKVTEIVVPQEFDDRFGRLRGIRTAEDGAVYVTTSEGADDAVLRVTPQRKP